MRAGWAIKITVVVFLLFIISCTTSALDGSSTCNIQTGSNPENQCTQCVSPAEQTFSFLNATNETGNFRPVIVNIQIDLENEEDLKYIDPFVSKIESSGWLTSVFVTGSFASTNPDAVKNIEARGHTIGVYGWDTGEDLSSLSAGEQRDLIDRAISAVKSAVNNPVAVVDFKPQNLRYNSDTLAILQDFHMRSITATFSADEPFVTCPYAKSIGRVTFPYPVTNDFYAVPVSVVQYSSEEAGTSGTSGMQALGAGTSSAYLDALKTEFGNHTKTRDPMVITVKPSLSGSDSSQATSVSEFIDYASANGGVVKPMAPITLLSTYLSSLNIISAPESASPGDSVSITVSYTTTLYCPTYYFRFYGKYAQDDKWDLRAQESYYVRTGTHSFTTSFSIPTCNGAKYIIKAVGQGCAGTCWPTAENYAAADETVIKLKNPSSGYFGSFSKTDIPGVDRYCPVSGGSCVELKPGDLIFRDMHAKELPFNLKIRAPFWHSAIYVGDGKIIEADGAKGTVLNRIYLFDSINAPWKGAETVFGFKKGLKPCEEDELRQRVVQKAYWYLGTPYPKTWLDFLSRNPKDSPLQCGQLIYKIYQSVGYDIKGPFINTIWPGIAPIDIYRHVGRGAIDGSGVLGPISYTNMADPPPRPTPPSEINKIQPYETITNTIPIDPTISEAEFFLIWENNSSILNLSVYKMEGTSGSGEDVVHEKDQASAIEYYIFNNPSPGLWTVDISGIQVPDTGENFIISTYFVSNLTFSPQFDNYWYGENENILVKTKLSNNDNAEINKTVIAEIFRPDNTSLVLTLFDDGTHNDEVTDDGIYTNVFSTNILGYYYFKFNANGTINNFTFERKAFADIEVISKTAHLNDNYSDYGSDTNGDGLFDYLTIESEVNIINSGNYTITGVLHTNETLASASNTSQFNPGIYKVPLIFSGLDISSHKLNGPYGLDAIISDDNNPVESITNVYFTSDYYYTQFISGGKIQGLISHNSNAVSNAAIILRGPVSDFMKSDINGSYIFEDLIAGIYTIEVTTPPEQNLLDISDNQIVEFGRTNTVNFDLIQGGEISGRITTTSEVAIPNATIYVSGPVSTSVRSDDNGYFRITKLTTGNYYLYIESPYPNFFSNSANIAVLQGQLTIYNFNLQDAGSIEGYVKGTDSIGIPNVIVYYEGYETPRFITDENGHYLMPRLYAGSYTIIADASRTQDYADNSSTITVALRETTRLDFVLQKVGSIEGIVMDYSFNPIGSIYITAYGPSQGQATTNSTGNFIIGRLQTGIYSVTAHPSWTTGFVSNATTVTVLPEETTFTTVLLMVGGVIRGTVTTEQGAPVPNAYVYTTDRSTNTDSNGNFTLFGLSSGNYYIQVNPSESDNLLPNGTTVFVSTGDTAATTIILPTGGIITGTVTNEAGSPVQDANVLVWSGPIYRSVYTGSDGRYSLQGLLPGTYTIQVNPPYGSPLLSNWNSTTINDRETVTLDIILITSGSVTTLVTDMNGTVVANAYVYTTAGPTGHYGYTNLSGMVIFTSMRPGNFTIQVNPPYGSHSVSNSTNVTIHGGTNSLLHVVLPDRAPPIPLVEVLDNPALTFVTYGDASWYGENTTWYYGGSAAQSGFLGDNQQSTLETFVNGPVTLSFFWKVSSEGNYDFLQFYLDGQMMERISGTPDSWEQKSFTLGSGNHSVRWIYTKDYSVSTGMDCGWVDRVMTESPMNLPVGQFYIDKNLLLKGDTFNVTIQGPAFRKYYLYFQNLNVPAGGYPMVIPGQTGVNITPAAVTEIEFYHQDSAIGVANTKSIITIPGSGIINISFTTNAATAERTFWINLAQPGQQWGWMWQDPITIRAVLPPVSGPGETQIATNASWQYGPSISGDRIVWADGRNGNSDIYLYDFSTHTESQITTNASEQYGPSISGNRIVWTDGRNGNSDIYLFDLSTSTESRITTNVSWRYGPSISGDRIVWADGRNGNSDIYLYDLSTHTESQITTNASWQDSPSIYGDRIVWADGRNGNSDIYLFDLSTSTESRITTNASEQYGPSISGNRIVWQDYRNGNSDIYLYDLTTHTESWITTNASQQYGPSIYGDRIVWVDFRNANPDIYLFNLTTHTEQPVCTDTADQYSPKTFGDHVVWEDYRGGYPDIYSYTVSISAPVANFTANSSSGFAPLTVQFADTSTGSPTSWNWSFGDGNFSVLQNPVHTYPSTGTYSVTLSVSNINGTNTRTKSDYITVTPPVAATSGWKFRADLNNSGVYDDGGIRPSNTLMWSFSTGPHVNPGPFVESSPAVADGVVYIGNSYGSMYSNEGKVFAINASTGSQIWSFAAGGDVTSSPAVSNGMVYIGSRPNNNGKIYAINATTGREVWNFPTVYSSSSPTVANGMVYFTENKGDSKTRVYALNATTGTQVWTFVEYTGNSGGGSSPAIVDGVVYVGGGDGKVYALDASTGTQVWTFTTGDLYHSVYSSPAVVNGRVYFGGQNGKVYAINANTGNQIWSYTIGSSITSSPAVANGAVYIGSHDGKVYALDASTGIQIWEFVAADGYSGGVLSSPAVANGVVYVGGWGSRSVYAINAGTGTQIWSYETGSSVESSPAVANGVVYFGSRDGMVYALGGSPLAPVANFTADMTYGTTPLTVTFSDTSTGSPISWNWSFGDGITSTLRNLTHTYINTGSYTVSLTVANGNGTNTFTRPQYITVTAPAGTPTLSFQPESAIVPLGSTTTYNVKLNSAPLGLSGYNITVALSNPSIGELVSVSYPSWASMPVNSSLPADRAWFKAVDLAGTSGTQNITFCTVTVRGDTPGTTNITILPERVEDRAGGRYNVTAIPAQLTVSSVQPLPNPRGGYFPLPTDPNHDGKYEDLDGNGWIGFNDVVVIYNNMETLDTGAYGPVSFFDYDNNGWIGFNDVVRLYMMI